MMSYVLKYCGFCQPSKWKDVNGELIFGYLCTKIQFDTFECKDFNDCIYKQIANQCIHAIDVYDNEKFYIDDKDICLGESCLAHRILDILDIEEVS